MSQFVTTSDIDAVVGGIRRQQVMDIVRATTFIGVVLLAWISMRPFTDLSDMEIGEVGTGNELPTYVLYAALAVLTVALAMRENIRGLATLLTPSFLWFIGWLCFTILLSFDRSTSIRRFSLTICVIAVTAALPLLAKSQDEILRWMSIAALVLLTTCYLGLLLVPDLSIHLASDPLEPGLAGNWRGSFSHKNGAAAIMVMIVFYAIAFVRAGRWISGFLVIGLATLFLFHAGGKSSMALCLVVLTVTSLTSVVRSFAGRVFLLLTPLLLLNMIGVGSVMSDSLGAIAKMLPLDSSFTGRTDIWGFALQSLQPKLLTGYGFAAFWGSTAIQGLPEGKEWAAFASHSHNGYLDTALGMGLPGLVLLIVALVIKPLRDFQRAEEGGNAGPLAMAFLQVWLFGIYLSSMESYFLDRADTIWVTLLLAVFGLHYLSRFRATAHSKA